MRFSDIHGLTATKEHFISSARNGQVAHAQLFSGLEGSALLPMALAFSSFLVCENPGDDACGTCPSCIKSSKYVHPDIHFVYPVSSAEGITGKDVVSKSFLSAWREFLLQNPYGNVVDWAHAFGGENKQLNISKQESREMIETLSLTAFEGKYKIMIVWMPELMHPSAANAILKVLEEPTPNTVFMLVSPDKDRLFQTIRSRTQLVQIPPFTVDELRHILENEYQIAPEKAAPLAHLADGSLRTAVQTIRETEIDLHAMLADWMRHCYGRKFDEISALADKFSALSKSGQKSFLSYTLEILRESLVVKEGKPELLRMSGEPLDFVKNFGKTLDMAGVELLSAQISDGYYHLERSVNPKFVFMNLSISFSKIFKR